MFKVLALAALLTGCVMLYLALESVRHDRKHKHWRWHHSLDVAALSAGFVCTILTSLYALAN